LNNAMSNTPWSPARQSQGRVQTWVTSQRKLLASPGQFSTAINREAFYELFEDEKSRSDRNFERVLTALHNATGRIEASFASKLHATIDPHMPVYDSWVRLNMSLKARSGPAQLRVPALCADYESIASSYAWIMGQPDYAHVRAAFDDALPDLRDIGDVKKVDLLLWQSRSP
uniref:hypothetical protein n=1 Tax=Sphingobium yanoikuyae TaxID=13690 RepID=UPI0035C75EA3